MPDFCCAMREKFLIGIQHIDDSLPDPPELVDFLDFERKTIDNRPVIAVRFCPFCGKVVGQTRVANPEGVIPAERAWTLEQAASGLAVVCGRVVALAKETGDIASALREVSLDVMAMNALKRYGAARKKG